MQISLRTHRVITTCPHCKAEHDRATSDDKFMGDGNSPDEGAINICGDCAGVSQYQAEGLLLKLVPFDPMQLPTDVQRKITILQGVVHEKMKRKGRA